MKKLCLGLIVITLFSLLITGCGGGTSLSPEQEAINTLLNQYVAAMKAENADQVVAYLTDPFTNEGTSTSVATYKLLLEIMFPLMTDFSITNISITVTDSSNASATLNEVTTTILGPASPVSRTYTFVKQGADWKIAGIANNT